MSIRSTTYLFFAAALMLCVVGVCSCGRSEVKSLTGYLDEMIENKQMFDREKEAKITALRHLLSVNDLTPAQEYGINRKLFEEFRKYRLDSAIHYVERNLQLARELGNERFVQESSLQLAPLYSFSGKSIESEKLLRTISAAQLPPDLLPYYYDAYSRFYQHYSTISSQEKYRIERDAYRDSIIMFSDPSSYIHRISLGSTLIATGRIDEAEAVFTNLLKEEDIDTPHYAEITHALGTVNARKQDENLKKKYYTLSAIADIRNSIKENASFQTLAKIYYDDGDISRAFRYAQSAIEDAVSSNVQFRTSEMSSIYSIINSSYRIKETKAKKQLQLYLIMISLLLLFLLIAVIYVYRQMKAISGIKEELSVSNGRLTQLNGELNERNLQLSESNLVKEQYIAQFFDLCSDYIDKMEDYRKSLNKLAMNRQFEMLYKKLASNAMAEGELEELYGNFDRIFLSLYPTFVSDFNSLLNGEERIILKSEDLLNRELRIFALLRLGITDNVRIASFLRCSMSTVYNYRSKARGNATVSKDDFERIVMTIGNIHPDGE